MNSHKISFKTVPTGFLCGAALLLTLTGCVGYVNGPSAGVQVETPGVVVVQDDYVYYPNYGVYYSPSRHEYADLRGGAWVSRPGPQGVSVDVVLASPAVRGNFRNAPAPRRAAAVEQPARTAAPPRANRVQKTNQKADKRDERNGN